MTQEGKELLIKDLCGRLPYNCVVIIAEGGIGGIQWTDATLNPYLFNQITEEDAWEYVKPYLRPMSSMTEKENLSLAEFVGVHVSARHGEIYFPNLSDNTVCNWHKVFDWLNKKMFDYRGLIPAGLALETPEGIYNN